MTTPHIRESVVEAHLVSECDRLNLLCYKVAAVGRRGLPDRLVLGHDSHSDPVTLFIELKRPGSTPRPSQHKRLRELRDHGAHCVVADSPAAVDAVLADYFTRPSVHIFDRDPHKAPLPGATSAVIRPRV